MCKLKVGDQVYWKKKVGMNFRTISGEITGISNSIATVVSNTQNTFGKQYSKHVDYLTKSK